MDHLDDPGQGLGGFGTFERDSVRHAPDSVWHQSEVGSALHLALLSGIVDAGLNPRKLKSTPPALCSVGAIAGWQDELAFAVLSLACKAFGRIARIDDLGRLLADDGPSTFISMNKLIAIRRFSGLSGKGRRGFRCSSSPPEISWSDWSRARFVPSGAKRGLRSPLYRQELQGPISGSPQQLKQLHLHLRHGRYVLIANWHAQNDRGLFMRRINSRVAIVGFVLFLIAIVFYLFMFSISSRSSDPVELLKVVGTVSGIVGGLAVAMTVAGLVGKKV